MLQFVEDVNGFDLVYVYVEYNIDNPKIIDDTGLQNDLNSGDNNVQCTREKFGDGNVVAGDSNGDGV